MNNEKEIQEIAEGLREVTRTQYEWLRLRDDLCMMPKDVVQRLYHIVYNSIARLHILYPGSGGNHNSRTSREPIAWYVRRNCPGKSDDGRKYGPFWKEEDADDWLDENHTKHPLYDLSHV